eukprot:scaffold56482_cov54-Phaeocystis_antarctica.AAC.1
MRSRRARPIGSECRCTGVGLANLFSSMFALSSGCKLRSANASIGAGHSSPLASTGMSSYASRLHSVSTSGIGGGACSGGREAREPSPPPRPPP